MNIPGFIEQPPFNSSCPPARQRSKSSYLDLSERIQSAVARISASRGFEEPLNPFSKVHRRIFTKIIPDLKEEVSELEGEDLSICGRYWNTWCKNVFKGPVLDAEKQFFEMNPKLRSCDLQKKLYEKNKELAFYPEKGMYRGSCNMVRMLNFLKVNTDDSIKELGYYDEILRNAIREHNAAYPKYQVSSNSCKKGDPTAFSCVFNRLSAQGIIKNFTEKQLRERWVNCASPDIIDVKIREEDESKILSLFPSEGKLSWSDISREFCERFGEGKFYYPANSIKNFYYLMQGRQKNGGALASSGDSPKPKVVKKRTVSKRKFKEIEEAPLVSSRFIKQKAEENLTSSFEISGESLSNNGEDDDSVGLPSGLFCAGVPSPSSLLTGGFDDSFEDFLDGLGVVIVENSTSNLVDGISPEIDGYSDGVNNDGFYDQPVRSVFLDKLLEKEMRELEGNGERGWMDFSQTFSSVNG